jgi:hypothetical protein
MFDQHAHRSAEEGTRERDERVVIDWDGSLADQSSDLRVRLAGLAEERIVAREAGLTSDPAYVEDLELERRTVRAAYAGAAVLQIARLRSGFDGLNQG